MRKIMVALIVAGLLSATTAVPLFANGGGGYSHERSVGFDPFWPVTAALTIPVAIVDTALQLALPAPVVYSRPAPYYAPGPYYAPSYYAPRVYVAPRGYYSQRVVYYPARGYREYRSGW
jgi:hypothetical protein